MEIELLHCVFMSYSAVGYLGVDAVTEDGIGCMIVNS